MGTSDLLARRLLVLLGELFLAPNVAKLLDEGEDMLNMRLVVRCPRNLTTPHLLELRDVQLAWRRFRAVVADEDEDEKVFRR